jgi:hypothetical protein
MNRDEIAQAMQDSAGQSWGDEAHFQRFADRVADAERNECAALVDANAMACHSPIYRSLLQSNAEAIRARGKDPMPLFDDWGMK